MISVALIRWTLSHCTVHALRSDSKQLARHHASNTERLMHFHRVLPRWRPNSRQLACKRPMFCCWRIGTVSQYRRQCNQLDSAMRPGYRRTIPVPSASRSEIHFLCRSLRCDLCSVLLAREFTLKFENQRCCLDCGLKQFGQTVCALMTYELQLYMD